MFALEVVLVVAWAVTLVTTLLNVVSIPRLVPVDWTRPARPGEDGIKATQPLPAVSIVVPARNEERTLERTLRALLAQTYEPLEVIVVNDGSTDSTGAIADRVAADDPRLVVIHGEDLPDGWLGKPWALHQGSRRARGELLLFVDADIHYAPQTVATLVERLMTRGVAMVSVAPRFEMHGFWEHVGMTQLAVAAFMLLPTWLGNMTRIVGLGLGGGPGTMVRREAFEEIGGYESLKDAVIDDIGMARQIRASGRRTEFVLGDTLASVRMYRGAREIIDGFTKNLFPDLRRQLCFRSPRAAPDAVLRPAALCPRDPWRHSRHHCGPAHHDIARGALRPAALPPRQRSFWISLLRSSLGVDPPSLDVADRRAQPGRVARKNLRPELDPLRRPTVSTHGFEAETGGVLASTGKVLSAES